MKYEEIYPSIIVYKDVVADIDKLYDLVVDSESSSKGDFILEEWIQWFTFGTYVSVRNVVDDGFVLDFKKNPNQDEWHQKEFYIYEQIMNATKRCIDHYVQFKNVKVPENSFITKPNIAKYIRLEWLDDDRPEDWGDYAMQFHTDYEIGKWFTKSRQFLLTANLYLNDDYEGGEIVFLHNENIIHYKPKKGDLIVFPSGSPRYPEEPFRDPYFHAVGVVESCEKYFTRSYLQYESDYSDYWYELKSSCSSDEEFNSKIESIYKSGHNTVGVFIGDKPYSGKSAKYSPKLNKNNKVKIWISASEYVELIYDVKSKNMYFRDSDGNHLGFGRLLDV